jgi:type II secretory pathway pseudopilin PulG
MTDPWRPAGSMALTCAEVEDLAALYVIDALSAEESAAVALHLATCPASHPSFAELAPLGPALARSFDPVDAPPSLRERVLTAVAYTPQVPDPLPGTGAAAPAQPTPRTGPALPEPTPDGGRPGLLERLFGGRSRGWVAAAALGLVLVLVGVGLVSTIQRSTEEARRAELLATAVRDAASGQANVATLTGTGSAEGAAGYAVFPADGPGYIVITGLPQLPSDEAFQAWYIADGVPVSAGLMELSPDGLGTLMDLEPATGTSVVALTVEPRPGGEAPTSDPVVAGELPVPA